MYVIDGFFYSRKTTGIQRFARNLVTELDALTNPGELTIVIPQYCPIPKELKNIKVIQYGNHKGYLWEQTDLARYLRKNKVRGVFFENAVPVLYKKGIASLHDISLKVNPDLFNRSLRGKISVFCWQRMYGAIVRSNMKIVTVSEFSKSEIQRIYKVPDERISVINNAWQHMEKKTADERVLEKLGLSHKNYYYAMATSAPNKNLKWITKAAKAYPGETFVIAGMGTESIASGKNPKNVIFAGYVSDSEAKALMAGCKAFLFPTFYEGFGLPPLEALACGAGQIIISDTPCMHEIYGDIGTYIDPYNYKDIRLPEREITEQEKEEFLMRYSWKRSAEKLYRLIKEDEG